MGSPTGNSYYMIPRNFCIIQDNDSFRIATKINSSKAPPAYYTIIKSSLCAEKLLLMLLLLCFFVINLFMHRWLINQIQHVSNGSLKKALQEVNFTPNQMKTCSFFYY